MKIEPVEINDIKQRLIELNQKYSDLEQEFIATQESKKIIQAEKVALEAHLAALRQIQKDDVAQDIQTQKKGTEESGDLTPVPDWLKTWQSSKNFEKTSAAIIVMGDCFTTIHHKADGKTPFIINRKQKLG
jgi:chromosome segregation ATPase